MLVLAHPWLLLLLPLPLLLRRWLPPHRERRVAVRAPFLARLAELSGDSASQKAQVRSRSRGQWALLILCWALIVVSLARPQWLEPPQVRELPMRDLLLAVDLSGSMDTEDFTDASGRRVDRLTAVKQVLSAFLEEREGDRVALVLFGSAAFVQAPFTADLDVVAELLDEAQVRMLGPRTMLGDALGLGINLFERSAVDERVMILLTDGNDTGSLVPPERAAGIAADRGVVIHTVAIGDPEAVGEQALDEATLRAVASATGGRFYRADDREGMMAIYAELDELNPKQVEQVSHRPRRDLFAWTLGSAVLLTLATLGLSSLGVGRRQTAPQTAKEMATATQAGTGTATGTGGTMGMNTRP